MSKAVNSLLELLDLEPLEVNLFRGLSPQSNWQRVFGGQVIGQALVAATRTVEARAAHSMHAYFLLGGDPKVPIVYEVDRIRDGKSFTTRRVVAIQHGQAIFTMAVSFHRDEPGFSHQAEMPKVPAPEELPSEQQIREKVMPMMPAPVRRYYEEERPIELRPVEYARYLSRCSTPLSFRTAAPSSKKRFRPRASTMRCGFTVRSAPTSGCSMPRTPRTHRARAGCRAV